MIKLIAADMDGTLINSKGGISKGNIAAIKNAQARGVRFAIATGRALCDVSDIIEEYDLKCDALIMNGAQYIDENNKIVSSTYIKKDRIKDILKVMDGYHNISAEIYSDDGFFTVSTPQQVMKGNFRRAKKRYPHFSDEMIINHIKNSVHYKNMQYISNLDKFIEENNIAKIISFADDEETINEITQKLNKISGLAVSGSFTTNVEINDENATKGKILLKAAEKYNIKRDEVAVLGDGMNDYSMFEEFPCSFAMENAVEEIKEASKYITDSYDEDGVAKAINKIIDENL